MDWQRRSGMRWGLAMEVEMRASRSVVVVGLLLTTACTLPGTATRSSAVAHSAECAGLVSDYVPPAADDRNEDDDSEDDHGSGHGNGQFERVLAVRLASPVAPKRINAARLIIARAGTRSRPVLGAAIHVSGTVGDYRVLVDLEQMVTERRWSLEDDDLPAQVEKISFPVRVRVAAASAIGRILEIDLQGSVISGTGGRDDDDHDHDSDDLSSDDGSSDDDSDDDETSGVTDAMTADAIAALMIGSCVGQPFEVRAASIEALGATRDGRPVEFLETLKNAPGQVDENENLVLEVVARRALTNILHNNHLAHDDADERLGELIRRAHEATNAQEAL